MLLLHRHPRRRRRAAAAVEMAAAMLVLSPLLVGTWETSRVIEVHQVLANAAREGGRQASTGLRTAAQVQAIVLNYVKNAGLPTTNATVSVQNLTSPGTDPTAATQLDQISVTVTINFRDVRWVSAKLVTDDNTTLTGQSTWVSVKDKPYPDPTPPPLSSSY